MKIDSVAKEKANRKNRLTEDLHVPIAAVDERAIETYVGEIVNVVSFNTDNRALLVRVPVPSKEARCLPIWDLRRSSLIHPELQLWVHIKYTAYRAAYQRAFPNEDIKGQVLHHTLSRRLAAVNGYDYLRLVPISRRVNSSMALPERWYMNLPHVGGDPVALRNNAKIHYGDLSDLLVIMGIVLGGGTMDVINEAQYLVDPCKGPWRDDNSPLKMRLRELGETV